MLLVKCYKYKTFTRIDCSSSLCGHNKTHFGLFFFFHHMRTPYAVIHHFLALLCSKQQTCFCSDPFLWNRWNFQAAQSKIIPPKSLLLHISVSYIILMHFYGLFALRSHSDVILMGACCRWKNKTSLWFIQQTTCAVWMLTLSGTLYA